jgi:hypothetical protein
MHVQQKKKNVLADRLVCLRWWSGSCVHLITTQRPSCYLYILIRVTDLRLLVAKAFLYIPTQVTDLCLLLACSTPVLLLQLQAHVQGREGGTVGT